MKPEVHSFDIGPPYYRIKPKKGRGYKIEKKGFFKWESISINIFKTREGAEEFLREYINKEPDIRVTSRESTYYDQEGTKLHGSC